MSHLANEGIGFEISLSMENKVFLNFKNYNFFFQNFKQINFYYIKLGLNQIILDYILFYIILVM